MPKLSLSTLFKAQWAIQGLAILIVGLVLLPAEIWKHPTDDQVYAGFDPNLIGVTNLGDSQLTADRIEILSGAESPPVFNLATSSLQRFNASIDVSITESQSAQSSFRIGVWSPWTGTGYFVTFGPAPLDSITVDSIGSGSPGPTLVGGSILNRRTVGSYVVGRIYHLAIWVDKTKGVIEASIGATSLSLEAASITIAQLPGLFSGHALSLTASTVAGSGTSRILLQRYVLTLPHARFWAVKINDPASVAITAAIALLSTLLLMVAIVGWINVAGARQLVGWWTSVRALGSSMTTWNRAGLLIASATLAYLLGNAALFPLGGHPFDMGNERLFAYVAHTYGADQLYYIPNTVSLTKIWGGVPQSESAFPYEPVMAYLFAGIGGLGSLIAAGGSLGPDDLRLDFVIKAVNVLFGLADAALIFLILRQLRASIRLSLTAAALFLFNPAVWFSMSVWGQNHVFSLFLILLAILFAERRSATLAWLALAAACLTRPQMLVFGLLLGAVFLRLFSLRENILAISWATVILFLAFVPLILTTSPSLPLDIARNNAGIQEGGGSGVVVTNVSEGAYSVWPLVTYALQGASGLQRSFTPSAVSLVGPVTYLSAGQLLTVAALVTIGALLLLQKRNNRDRGTYLPLIALGITSFLMLLTGLVATYFVLALPFILLCRPWLGNTAYFFIAAVWTVTTLVPMYGEMGVLVSFTDHSVWSPTHNSITMYFVKLSSWDRFMTAAVIANICAVAWLAISAVRQPTPDLTRRTAF